MFSKEELQDNGCQELSWVAPMHRCILEVLSVCGCIFVYACAFSGG